MTSTSVDSDEPALFRTLAEQLKLVKGLKPVSVAKYSI